MKNLELNPEFNLLGQIDLNSVKFALDRDEMEEIVGGYGGGGGRGSNCKLGIRLATVFVGGAFALATAGVGSFVVGGVFGMAGSYFEDYYC